MRHPPGGFCHMVANKRHLRGAIEQYGAKVFGEEWEGRTKEDALQALRDDPREFIPVGHCDNQDENGECLGHSAKEE